MIETKLTALVNESDHVQGSKNAPIILVEYGDYECSYCGEAYPIVKHIQSQLGDRLCFVFRNFPLAQMHPHAAQAAAAAEAANAQGHFWEMHDLLYENQENLEDTNLIGYATNLGLNKAKFATDLRNGNFNEKVQDDFMSGAEDGVNGTPTFFINGDRYDGDWQGGGLLTELRRRGDL
jgi:protein-disulfide isomerase